jgi:hypothetical protein
VSQISRLQEGRFCDRTCNDTHTSYAYTMLLRITSDFLEICELFTHIVVDALPCVFWPSMSVIQEGSVSDS